MPCNHLGPAPRWPDFGGRLRDRKLLSTIETPLRPHQAFLADATRMLPNLESDIASRNPPFDLGATSDDFALVDSRLTPRWRSASCLPHGRRDELHRKMSGADRVLDRSEHIYAQMDFQWNALHQPSPVEKTRVTEFRPLEVSTVTSRPCPRALAKYRRSR